MRYAFVTVAVAAGLFSFLPSTVAQSYGIIRLGQCGAIIGKTCHSIPPGQCCSHHGWCGEPTAYCGIGCQSASGDCAVTGTSVIDTCIISSTSVPDSNTVSSSVSVSPTATVNTATSSFHYPTYVSLLTWQNATDMPDTTTTTISPPTPTTSVISQLSTPYDGKISRIVLPVGATSVALCLRNFSIPFFTAADGEAYANASTPFNLRLHYTPAIITYPRTAAQVADVVKCASGGNTTMPPTSYNSLKVQARSGGHSYAAYSLGGTNGSLIVDLANLNSVSVDEDGLATVGGGARLGDMFQKIYAQGQWGMAHGTCPGIGIGGHATHGGYGYSSRSWGLALDAIVGLEVVLANSSIITASKKSYPKLYWALRGAADSLGIVTTFYFQTQKTPNTVVNFNYFFDLMDLSAGATPQAATDAFLHIQEVAQNASVIDRRNSWGMFINAGTFQVRGVFNGTTQDPAFEAFEAELLRGLPKPVSTNNTNLSWMENAASLGGNPDASFNVPVPGTAGSNDTFFAKSVVVPEGSPLTNQALLTYFTYLQSKGNSGHVGNWFSIPNLYGGPDSQINVKDTSFAAYSDRNALWVFQHYSSTVYQPFSSSAYDFVTGMNQALEEKMPSTRFSAYLNYVDPSYDAHTAHKYYYGVDVSKKLLELKRIVDPGNVFWNPQAFVA